MVNAAMLPVLQELQQQCREQAADLAGCRQQLQLYEGEYTAELCRLR